MTTESIIQELSLLQRPKLFKAREVSRSLTFKRDPIRIAVVKFLQERDGRLCQICKGAFFDEFPSIDHIKPAGLGGEHQLENFQLAHLKCNNTKGMREQES